MVDQPEKLSGIYCSNSPCFCSPEIPEIMRYNISATGSDCQLKKKVVIGVWQRRTPEKENFLQMTYGQEVLRELVR